MAKKKSKGKKLNTDSKFWNRSTILSVTWVLFATLILFSPALNNGMVYWDDDRNFYENQHVNNPSSQTIIEDIGNIFRPENNVIGNYNPLTISIFRLENTMFGMEEDSWKYWHGVNILLHLLCIFFAFILARRLGLNNWGASLVIILFAIHPMRVESVVWLTELKDVLFASFYLLALVLYIRGKRKQFTTTIIVGIIVLFILSCLSKVQAVALPLSMLAIDYYLDNKLSWKSLFSKWYLFVISLFFGLLNIYTLSLEGSLGNSNTEFSFFQRIFVGSYSYCVYLIKSIYPYRMVPMYPYPSSFSIWYYLSMIPALGVVAMTVYFYIKKKKAIVFGILFFTFNIMFLLQIVGAGQGFIADRFTYIPYLGLFFIAGFYFQKVKWSSIRGKIISYTVLLYVGFLGYLTTEQIPIWKNSYTMWTHVIDYYPNTKLPWGNRANYLRDIGKNKEALADYTKRLSLGQDDPDPFNSRGKLYFNSNNPDTLKLALQDYNEAIRLEPDKSEYYVNRGSTKARLGDPMGAIEDYNKAEELLPGNPQLHYNRSIINHQIGNYQAEKADIEKYLQSNPNHIGMLTNHGAVLRLLGQVDKAIVQLNKSISLQATPHAILERAKCYIQIGDKQKAQQDIATLQSNGIEVPQGIINAVASM